MNAENETAAAKNALRRRLNRAEGAAENRSLGGREL
jgi:hypothetical protein